jgi:signal transduction histidine kinase
MIPSVILPALYFLLFVIVLLRRSPRNPAAYWLLAYCAYSALWMGVLALLGSGQVVIPSWLSLARVLDTGLALSTGLTALLTLSYMGWGLRDARFAVIGLLIWIGAVIILLLLGNPPLLAGSNEIAGFLRDEITLGTELGAVGWLVSLLALFAITWRRFLVQELPLYANRILFWAVVLPFMLLGDILAVGLLRGPWEYLGHGIRLIGTAAAVYGISAYRVMDLRRLVRWLVSHTIITIVSGAAIIGGIAATIYLDLPGLDVSPATERAILGILAALVVAVILPPVNRLMRWMLRNMINRDTTDPAEAVRLYSQRIGGVIDLKVLAQAVTRTINELLSTQRSLLILATIDGSNVVLDEISPIKSDIRQLATLSQRGTLYRRLIQNTRPVLQYDLDYSRSYIDAEEGERGYFRELGMDIYAPITRDSHLIGLLAVGPKTNDDPFNGNEIELLEALANQTITALENARLVSDLRRLNETMQTLNKDLHATNERLARLDAVKSDFITIASHELRTPLTQIQGYTDMLKEMAKRRILDPAETVEVTSNLSTASQRMGEVITAMLEVSQIDVDSMDLTFTEISLAHVLTLAVEPYAQAVRERKQLLAGKGLSALPSIYGDYRRLVQAFQNLITNAIKFTPDGGQIEITGEIYQRDPLDQPLTVRVSIADTGVGIDRENLQLIFEKFYRVGSVDLHSTGKTKFKGAGPGLGLSIARGIVEGHGGTIWVESIGYDEETCPGSCFHVVLPLRPPSMRIRQQFKELKPVLDEVGPDLGGNPTGHETIDLIN